MRMYDIIVTKRDGLELSDEQLKFVIEGFVGGSIPDYQMSAFLMTIYLNGLNERETAQLTNHMAHSGDMIDLSSIKGVKVDKHSTGGVGDKTTLICGPIVAACGVTVAKMSGRGLGHTGGTVDKLESIPGYKLELSKEDFFRIVNEIGISVIGQSGNIAPGDKKIYALRDVIGAVGSMPLIASSIMSKKLASGANAILLDVKTGSGALMKTTDEAIELAQQMVSIGEHNNRKMASLITNMDIPLGHNVGNQLEIVEVVDTLKGNGPEDLTTICLELAAHMLYLADMGSYEECYQKATTALENGSAYEKFELMVQRQGGDISYIRDLEKFTKANIEVDVKAEKDGYIYHINTEEIGIASVMLGAGRETKEDSIDYSAGIVINAKTGDYVNTGDSLVTIYTSSQKLADNVIGKIKAAYVISDEKPELAPLICAKILDGKTIKY